MADSTKNNGWSQSYSLQLKLSTAKKCMTEGNKAEALDCCIEVYRTFPESRNIPTFTHEVVQCFQSLCGETPIALLSKYYQVLVEFVPSCADFHNIMGATCYRRNELEMASDCYNKLLNLHPHSSTALENMDNINCQMVDRWHYEMLNDLQRNVAFQKAIDNAYSNGHRTILDIGSGTCLLSMMAAHSGFMQVFACDENQAMCRTSKKILESNNMADRVCLLNKHSTDLSINSLKNAISERDDNIDGLDVVVTETVDCGIFGERILSTLSHAWQHLLAGPGKSLVIPAKAELFCCLIECPDIIQHHRCTGLEVEDIDLKDMIFVDATSQPVKDLPLADMFEPYTTYNLNAIRGGYRKLSYTKKCIDVNFNDPQQIDHLLHGHEEFVNLTVQEDGTMHALALWFTLHVAEGISLTSDPESSAGCWHPAIFPLSNLTDNSARVVAGDCLRVKAATADNCIQLELTSPLERESNSKSLTDPLCGSRDEKGQVHSSKSSEYTCGCTYVPADSSLGPTVLSSSKFYLKSTEIYRLNNNKLDRALFSAMLRLKSSRQSFTMLDMSPMFSTLPAQACAAGAKAAYWLGVDEYYSALYRMLSYRTGLMNAIGVPDVESVEGRDIDCVLCDLVEPSGVLRHRVLNDLAYLKLTSLKGCAGRIIPSHLCICAQAIKSQQLVESNQVLKDRTCNFDISSHFNQFRARTQRDIDMSTLTYTACSDVMQLMTLDFNSTRVDAEGLPEFLNQERVMEREELSRHLKTLVVDAIVYWFEMSVDTETVSTLIGHWRQAAVVLPYMQSNESHDKSHDTPELTSLVVKVENGTLSLSTSTHLNPH